MLKGAERLNLGLTVIDRESSLQLHTHSHNNSLYVPEGHGEVSFVIFFQAVFAVVVLVVVVFSVAVFVVVVFPVVVLSLVVFAAVDFAPLPLY